MKTKPEYRVEVNIYYDHNSVYSSHLTASSKTELVVAMRNTLLKHKAIPSVEVVSFYGARKITTTEIKGLEKSHKLTKKVKNAYIKHQYK